MVASISAQIWGEAARVPAEAKRSGEAAMWGCGPGPGGAWPARPRVPEPRPPAPPAHLPAMLLPLRPAKRPGKGDEAVSASTWLRLTSAALSCRQRHNAGVLDFLVTLAKIQSFPQVSFFSLCTLPYRSPAAGAGRGRGWEEGGTFTCKKQGEKAKCQQQENTPVLI